jgi:hypothetical protein
MENNVLHTEKVKILSRLVKESSLTFEEALLLLKEEEKEEQPVSIGNSGYGTVTVGSYPPLGTWSTGTSTGSTFYTVPPSFISMSGSSTINNTADDSADLNN